MITPPTPPAVVYCSFSTSRQTLTWIPDTFFTALLSGRISSLRDEHNAIFIDRDPTLFSIILNYLRTKDIDIKNCEIRALRHEAEYYGITPLTKRLALCEDLNHSSCGDVLFTAFWLHQPCLQMMHFRPQWKQTVQWSQVRPVVQEHDQAPWCGYPKRRQSRHVIPPRIHVTHPGICAADVQQMVHPAPTPRQWCLQLLGTRQEDIHAMHPLTLCDTRGIPQLT